MGLFGSAIWVASFLLEVYVVLRCIHTRSSTKYISIGLFAGAMALRDPLQFFVLNRYGVSSHQYLVFYFYTDALLTVLMYLTIMHLFQQVFERTHVGAYVRRAAVLLLGLTALFSYLVVRGSAGYWSSRFVWEFSQDLYFVGLVLTYLLWAAVFRLRETRTRLVQLVLALGIYFSGMAALYAVPNMFPSTKLACGHLYPVLSMLLLASWAYTFTRIPEGARLAPAHLVREATAER